MKKLMILAAVAMAAVCTQAASISWQLSDATATGQDGFLVYLVTTADDFKDVASIKENLLAVTAGDNTGTIAKGRSGEMLKKTAANTAWGDADPISFYYVILNAKTEANATGYWISPEMTATAVVSGTPSTATYGTLGTLATDANLKSFGGDVPEPTSAMLLLLGVAGLALRRRA